MCLADFIHWVGYVEKKIKNGKPDLGMPLFLMCSKPAFKMTVLLFVDNFLNDQDRQVLRERLRLLSKVKYSSTPGTRPAPKGSSSPFFTEAPAMTVCTSFGEN